MCKAKKKKKKKGGKKDKKDVFWLVLICTVFGSDILDCYTFLSLNNHADYFQALQETCLTFNCFFFLSVNSWHSLAEWGSWLHGKCSSTFCSSVNAEYLQNYLDLWHYCDICITVAKQNQVYSKSHEICW